MKQSLLTVVFSVSIGTLFAQTENLPPVITAAYGSFSMREVTVHFSRAVDSSAEQASNYTISDLAVQSVARVGPDVVKLTTADQVSGRIYRLQASGIRDQGGGAASPVPLVTRFVGFPKPKFSTDFTSQPPNTRVFGNSGSVHQGHLKLTIASGNLMSSMVVQDLDQGVPMGGGVVAFKVRAFGGTVPPADGYSLCFAPNLPDGAWGEEGAGSGLTIAFDSYNNNAADTAPEAPAIEAKLGGVAIQRVMMPTLTTGDRWVDVLLVIHPDGAITLVYDGKLIFANLPCYSPMPGRFGLGARTGGATENYWFDDLVIGTFTTNVDATAPTLLSAYGSRNMTNVTVTYSEAVSDTATNAANYSLDGSVQVLKALRVTPSVIRLETTAQAPLVAYTLRVSNVQDMSAVPNTIAANSAFTFRSHDPDATFFTDFSQHAPGTRIVAGRLDAGALKLTENVNSQSAIFIVDDLNQGKLIQSFRVRFKVYCGGGSSPPADGYSFNFGPGIPELPLASAEEGQCNGLIVAFDIFDNGGGEAPAVDIKFDNVTLASRKVGSLVTGGFVDVEINVDPDGTVDVIWAGQTLHSNVPAYLTPVAGNMAIAARTGGLNARHHFDDLWIKTVPVPPDVQPPVLLSAAASTRYPDIIHLVFSEPLLESTASNPLNYTLVPEVPVASAAQSPSGTRVVLQTAAPLDPATLYRLSIQDVTDRATSPNDLGPNPLDPNPTVVDLRLGFIGPEDVGSLVEGFQDDFSAPTRNPLWVAVGPGGNVYTQTNGVLRVRTASGDPNHLLYRASGYHRSMQEVLARIRVNELGEAVESRAGIGVGVNSASVGINLEFKNFPFAGKLFRLNRDPDLPGPEMVADWENEAYYWLRMKNLGTRVLAKIWPGDGSLPEPEEWDLDWVHNFTLNGHAGISATSLNALSVFEVDYILIKAQGLPEITVDPEICRVVVAGCETLTIARNAGGNVLITWQGNCVLQSAPSVTGPFADVPGASGGSYAVPLTEPARFYRLRRP